MSQPVIIVVWGSSPHTRGAPQDVLDRLRQAGIIPAYAGSTFRGFGNCRNWGDHPRIRGEHVVTISDTRGMMGSSPHTRGAHGVRKGVGLVSGIIPAYAGSTLRACRAPVSDGDHPRIRGEHFSSVTKVLTDAGSSPHTRGAPGAKVRRVRPEGIIPAYAGSTRHRTRRFAQARDHPRIRGEHSSRSACARECLGSSPHTRGAR